MSAANRVAPRTFGPESLRGVETPTAAITSNVALRQPMPIPDHTSDTPTFTGMPLDRAMDERMDPAVIAGLLDDPHAEVVAASERGVLIADGDRPGLRRMAVARQLGERAAQTDDQPMLLGLDDGAPLFALDLDELAESERGNGHGWELTNSGSRATIPDSSCTSRITASSAASPGETNPASVE